MSGCATSGTRPAQARVAAEPLPIVIAHRGASGYRPEHTLAAYTTAVLEGADFIELDLVSTRDGHLIARHDNVLNLTTDVARRPEFAARQTEKIIDGRQTTGWFSEDFTLEEMGRMRAVERIPEVRPRNAQHDGVYPVPTLDDVISLVEALEDMLGREIGLYIELKHPAYFDALGLAMERKLVDVLSARGYSGRNDRVYLQSFEIASLRRLDAITDLRLVQLLGGSGQPFDVEAAGGTLTYATMATAAGLDEIAQYADGVGPDKNLIVPRDAAGMLRADTATNFVEDAHAAGLVVHAYTFRAENAFLPANFRSSSDATELGDAALEIAIFLALRIDGFFTDQTRIGVDARDAFLDSH